MITKELQVTTKELLTNAVTEETVKQLTWLDKLPNYMQSLLVVVVSALVAYVTETTTKDITLVGSLAAIVGGLLSWLTSERQKLIGKIQGATSAVDKIVHDKPTVVAVVTDSTTTDNIPAQTDKPPKVELGD